MALNDILLQIDSYPERTPPAAVDQAVQFAAMLGGKISALAMQIDIRVPTNRLADYLIGLSKMAEDEEVKSLHACREVLEQFTERAKAAGVFGEALAGKADLYCLGEYVAERARTRDLCIVPIADSLDGQRAIAEAVIFGAGRPTLLYRTGAADLPQSGLKTVVQAWDGSRAAARAMGDALPLLKKANEVRVLTIVNEKPDAVTGEGADAVRHLKAHGVNAVAEEIDAGGKKIGAVLDRYMQDVRPDLFVMGAYGRSRVREFILGGATEYVLHDPKTPLLLSH